MSIARDHQGRLRSVAVQALRVLSDDVSPVRQTRLRLCEAGAVEALGTMLKDNVGPLDVKQAVDGEPLRRRRKLRLQNDPPISPHFTISVQKTQNCQRR